MRRKKEKERKKKKKELANRIDDRFVGNPALLVGDSEVQGDPQVAKRVMIRDTHRLPRPSGHIRGARNLSRPRY